MTMRRQRSAFTLVEVIVTLLVFSIFSIALVATLSLVLKWWFKIKDPALAEQNARVAAHTIANDFRQAVPNPLDPNSPIQAAGPGVLSFYTPIPGNYDPSAAGFSSAQASNYQLVTYMLINNPNAGIWRLVTTAGPPWVAPTLAQMQANGTPIVQMTIPNPAAGQPPALTFSPSGVPGGFQLTPLIVSASEASEGGVGANPADPTGGGVGANYLYHSCSVNVTTFFQH